MITCGLGPAARHEQRADHGALPLPHQEEILQRTQGNKHLPYSLFLSINDDLILLTSNDHKYCFVLISDLLEASLFVELFVNFVLIFLFVQRKPMALIKKLRKKKEAPANEKLDVVKTHLR